MEAESGNSAVRRILLGSTLRRLREDQGITMKEAGYHIRGSEAKISRMETGKVSFKERDVEDLLTFYKVTDPVERAQTMTLVHEANTLGWWNSFNEVIAPWFGPYVGLEDAASLIRTYDLQFVNGLLQTPEYSRAVIASNRSLGSAEVNKLALMRQRRQQKFADPATSPKLWVVLDESAVRRPIGGPEVMRRQVEFLLTASLRRNVTIQLLPYSAGAHAAESGAFTLLRFSEPDLADVVYLEHLTGAQYIERPDDTSSYLEAADQIAVDALTPDDTRIALEYLLSRD
ncbi:MAG TPA: helix-turn-helix transcriptional regulator [Actinocrinis sp.]|nr:helix-turn-helix transcriptional regulator [Actinocrinis sp.]